MYEVGFVPALPWVLPFVAMLLSISLLPLFAPRFWGSNLRKLAVAAALALPVLALYLGAHPAALWRTAEDYVSFIVLLGSLFVISGGIVLEGDLRATPRNNAAFLGAGALLASLVGTTGASMLLIRPLLQSNQERRHVWHTAVFFIFLVSNVGGCLTPLGDPPLFLGYLQGVPFAWTLRLLPEWAFATGAILLVYYAWDRRTFAREAVEDLLRDRMETRPLRLSGKENLAFLLVVVMGVALLRAPWREGTLLALAVLSWLRTKRGVREANRFTFQPILEVAAVFAGIFGTMLPALDLLRAHGARLGVREPWQFFWAAGGLSSFLDNAPTYLTFLALAQGQGQASQVAGVSHEVLRAISLGAVFMGANTYIGNGPNFMVRAIAEERGVRMPSFGGYMITSATVLVPIFVLVTLVFLR
jgi:Na+/H+ antiporter NhaD/arsenite permease-like protein